MNRRIVLSIGMLLVFLVNLFLMSISAGEEAPAVQDPLPEYKEVTTDYEGSTIGFIYSDEMLKGDARQLSTDLAKASIVLAAAAYNRKGDNSARRIHDVEKDMGFTPITGLEDNYGKKGSLSDMHFVAFSIAKKDINKNGETYRVYCVPIRGTPTSVEWMSDFILQRGNDYHYGFYTAEEKVRLQLQSVLDNDDFSDDHTILWITGHSRGAAVANMLAGFLTSGKGGCSIPASQIFAYTYACPNVAMNSKVSGYSNIRNFNNTGDLIPALPLKEWGFGRFGITIPCAITRAPAAISNAEALLGESFASNSSTDKYTQLMLGLVPTLDDYFKPIPQALFQAAGWFLGGNNDVPWYELIPYLNGTLWVRGGESNIAHFSQYLEHVGTLIDTLDGLLKNPIGELSFSEFISDVVDLVNEAKTLAEMQIDNISNLTAAISTIRDMYDTAKGIYAGVRFAVILLWDKSQSDYNSLEDYMSAITIAISTGSFAMKEIEHGHQPKSYIGYINDIYFGYHGHQNADLSQCTIGPNITTIGEGCFRNATGKDFTIPDGVCYVGKEAFYGSSLESISIPNSTIGLGDQSFARMSNLKNLAIPVEQLLHKTAFYSSGASSVQQTANIEKLTVTAGRTGVMEDLTSWSSTTIQYLSINTLTEVVMDDNITNIGDYAFVAWNQADTQAESFTINIPSKVTRIGKYAFDSHRLTGELVLPDGLKELGISAFNGVSGTTALTLPSSLTVIPDLAFFGMEQVEELVIPDEVETIGASAFACWKGLKNLTIPVEHFLNTKAFYITPSTSYNGKYTTNVEQIHVTAGRTGVMEDLTSWSSTTIQYLSINTLTEVVMDDNITNIGDYAFVAWNQADTQAESFTINIPSNVTRIGESAFDGHRLTGELLLPEGLAELGISAFNGVSGTTALTLPSSLTVIPNLAFFGMEQVEELVIPDEVETIGASAFACWKGLKNLTIPVEHFLNTKAFYITPSTSYNGKYTTNVEQIHVTAGRTGVMEDLTSWSDRTIQYLSINTLTEVVMDDNITNIGDYAFVAWNQADTQAESFTINIPSKVTRIGKYAFDGHRLTGGLVLPEGLTELGIRAFNGVSGTTALTLPSSLTVIPNLAFFGMKQVNELVIPDEVETIGESAFAGWEGLKNLTIPVEHFLNTKAFYDSSNAKKHTANVEQIHVTAGRTGVMEDLTSWSSTTIQYLSINTLTEVVMDDNITNIGDYAFVAWNQADTQAESFTINIPSNVTRIGKYAFDSHNITGSVIVPMGTEEIGVSAFRNIGIPVTVHPYSFALDYVQQNSIAYVLIEYKTFTLPAMMTELEDESFENTSAEMIVLPETDISIGLRVFADSNLHLLVVKGDIISIHDSAFDGCDHVTIMCRPDSYIAEWAKEKGLNVIDLEE